MTEKAGGPRADELLEEFKAARENFEAALAKVIDRGALRPVEATCGVGEVCHGGTF
jgi:hypothetical protein